MGAYHKKIDGRRPPASPANPMPTNCKPHASGAPIPPVWRSCVFLEDQGTADVIAHARHILEAD